MKTSEDKLNEALRAALQRKFDDFEDVPNPSAFRKIRANIKPGRQWKYLFFTLLFVGITIVGIMTDQHFMKKDTIKASVTKTAVSSTEVNKTKVTETEAANIALRTELVSAKQSVNHKILAGKNEKLAIKSFENKKISNTILLSKNVESSVSAISQDQPQSNFVNSPISVTPQLSGPSFSNSRNTPDSVRGENAEELLSQFKTTDIDNRIESAINEMENQPVTIPHHNADLPEVRVPKNDVKPVVKHSTSSFSWLVNVAVLQSYQILTVPSGGQSFQNFEFPSTFSLQSLGYKFSVGVEKKGFQFMLHYGRFQQSYSYEIAGNDYIVPTFDKDHFKVIRQGTRVSQDNKFSLLGIGANKQVSWGNASVGKYYATAGLEYSYGLIRKQSIGWVNASIGKQFPISKNTSLHIGPYAEFSPVKFAGSGDPFYYQPYRVGISAGLRLSR
ncbi:hypothetical protein MUK70_08150 [Dyadobacter chenwenxiniae]|uniref:Uncharacterized protein n=1 Tax=Dyadobacter chenwenxiniae TaxID=2906456 RepID=A0A9X1PQ95_9BACT|nr:hypothetical protein [Dyadobacter chenwenxiniae]MCF0062871.1 hypothetical protein [Dyadobacter chenwenxiniae]UON84954.1 hypothetical protein MUK70_08150 [Dyadobacter chenwenxiniae]